MASHFFKPSSSVLTDEKRAEVQGWLDRWSYKPGWAAELYDYEAATWGFTSLDVRGILPSPTGELVTYSRTHTLSYHPLTTDSSFYDFLMMIVLSVEKSITESWFRVDDEPLNEQ